MNPINWVRKTNVLCLALMVTSIRFLFLMSCPDTTVPLMSTNMKNLVWSGYFTGKRHLQPTRRHSTFPLLSLFFLSLLLSLLSVRLLWGGIPAFQVNWWSWVEAQLFTSRAGHAPASSEGCWGWCALVAKLKHSGWNCFFSLSSFIQVAARLFCCTCNPSVLQSGRNVNGGWQSEIFNCCFLSASHHVLSWALWCDIPQSPALLNINTRWRC